MKSSALNTLMKMLVPRKRLLSFAVISLLIAGFWKAGFTPERSDAPAMEKAAEARMEKAESAWLPASSAEAVAATQEEAAPLLHSPFLDTENLEMEEWRSRAGTVEGIFRLRDGRRVVFSARKNRQGHLSIRSAAIAGEYILRTDDLPWSAWQAEKYFRRGRIQVLESNKHLTQIRVPAEDLRAIETSETMLFRHLGKEQVGRNGLVYPVAAPDDPKYAASWALAKLDLEPVWEKFGFSPEASLARRPIIAVVDNGAPADYPDYHYWVNEDEVPGNGIDDDGNGYVDDLTGYNFHHYNSDLSFSGGHGSSIARISASITNNGWGSASPASSAALMRVNYYEKAAGTHWGALSAMLYAGENGADVINCSFVSQIDTMFSYVIREIGRHGGIVVAAAGNNRINLDDDSMYPASSPEANVITVGASNAEDERAASNFSATQVDVFAPGEVTSFATPLVTSTLALLRALDPSASSSELIAAVVEGADPVHALEGLCVANGRLNTRGAVESLLGISLSEEADLKPEAPEPPQAPVFADVEASRGSIKLSWSELDGIDGFEIHYSEDGNPFLPVEPSSMLPATVTSLVVDGLLDGTDYKFRLRTYAGSLYSDWTPSALVATPESSPEPVQEPGPTPEVEGRVPAPLHYWDITGVDGNPFEDTATRNYPMLVESVKVVSDEIDGHVDQVADVTPAGKASLESANSTNLQIRDEYTISFWVRPSAESLVGRPVLFEQGGGSRGLCLHLDEGRLVAGAWNAVTSESGWQGTWLQGPALAVEEWVHIGLTLSGGEEVGDSGLTLHINGQVVAEGPASQLWRHSDGIGIGTVSGKARVNGEVVSSADPFAGAFDDLAIWHTSLSEAEFHDWIGITCGRDRPAENCPAPIYEPAPGSPVVTKPDPNGEAEVVAENEGGATPAQQDIYSAPQLDANGNVVVVVPDPAHFWDFEEGNGAWAMDGGYDPVNLKVTACDWVAVGNGETFLEFPENHPGVRMDGSTSINLETRRMLTIAMWVRPDESAGEKTSVLYEQGGYWRGLNLLLENGRLQANGWNKPDNESGWNLTTLHGGDVLLGQWNHVAVVLEAGDAVKEGSFRLFLNGNLVDAGAASQLWVHSGAIGLGQVQGTTLYRDQGVRELDPFQGCIDDLAVWEAPLYGAQIEELILSRSF
ncbi:MAG: S8 family serine peptidase [Verrucomicrobia bacterium]|nr:S8 family serine peptidase [Verrucomicrobiota bacterium]